MPIYGGLFASAKCPHAYIWGPFCQCKVSPCPYMVLSHISVGLLRLFIVFHPLLHCLARFLGSCVGPRPLVHSSRSSVCRSPMAKLVFCIWLVVFTRHPHCTYHSVRCAAPGSGFFCAPRPHQGVPWPLRGASPCFLCSVAGMPAALDIGTEGVGDYKADSSCLFG